MTVSGERLTRMYKGEAHEGMAFPKSTQRLEGYVTTRCQSCNDPFPREQTRDFSVNQYSLQPVKNPCKNRKLTCKLTCDFFCDFFRDSFTFVKRVYPLTVLSLTSSSLLKDPGDGPGPTASFFTLGTVKSRGCKSKRQSAFRCHMEM